MVAHGFNDGSQLSVSLRPASSKESVPEQSTLLNKETLFQKNQKTNKILSSNTYSLRYAVFLSAKEMPNFK